MGYAFNYSDFRATPVKTGGVVAKLMKVSKPNFSFIKPKFRTFMLGLNVFIHKKIISYIQSTYTMVQSEKDLNLLS